MTPKLLPTTLILGCVALLAFAFVLPTNTNQPAATAYAQSTPSVSFTQEEVQAKEGSTIYLKVRLNAPVTKTTKVTIKLTPDAGTTSRDIPGLTGTKTVTFYKNGSTSKTVAIRTSRTTAEGDKSLTASITKVGNTTVQGDTARVLVKDQKSTGTILTGNQNNNTATTTPPTNCEQYAGVIPGETRRLRVQQGKVNVAVYSPNAYYGSISAEGLRQLKLMYGDIGYGFSVGGDSSRNRVTIPSGTVLAFKFKTSEYNYPPYAVVGTYDHPGTLPGVIGYSVSECPGDFTSPAVLAQKSGNDVRNVFGDGMWRDCVSYNASIQSAITFGVGAGPYKCNLEPNKTYYLNVTAGFIYDKGPGTPYPYMERYGHDPATSDGRSETSIDILTNNFGTQEASRQVYGDIPNPPPVEMIKNRSAAYAEIGRIQEKFTQFISESSAKRQACYADIRITDRTSPAYRAARLACLNDNNPPLPPFTASENY